MIMTITMNRIMILVILLMIKYVPGRDAGCPTLRWGARRAGWPARRWEAPSDLSSSAQVGSWKPRIQVIFIFFHYIHMWLKRVSENAELVYLMGSIGRCKIKFSHFQFSFAKTIFSYIEQTDIWVHRKVTLPIMI